MQTNIEGVFSGGDCVTGAATVVEAIGGAKKAVRAMNAFLAGGDRRAMAKAAADQHPTLFDIGAQQSTPSTTALTRMYWMVEHGPRASASKSARVASGLTRPMAPLKKLIGVSPGNRLLLRQNAVSSASVKRQAVALCKKTPSIMGRERSASAVSKNSRPSPPSHFLK